MNFLQKVQMASMKKVKRACDVNDFIARARVFWGSELHDFVTCLQELIDACPGRIYCVVLSRKAVYSSSLRLVFFWRGWSQIARVPQFAELVLLFIVPGKDNFHQIKPEMWSCRQEHTGKVLYNKLNKLVTIGLFFYCSYRLTLIFILTKVA